MYKLETYIKEDRIPYMIKTEICEGNICTNDSERVFEMLNIYFDLGLRSEEYMYMLALDRKCNVLGIFEISHGSINQTITSPREIFMKALLAGASGIILAHNHPTGDVTPSFEDRKASKRIYEAGNLLGIELLDFIIISEETFYSFRKEGDLHE